MWADISRWRHLTCSIEPTHITAPLAVITDAVLCLAETEAGAAVTCHDVTPIHSHCQWQQQQLQLLHVVTNDNKHSIISL